MHYLDANIYTYIEKRKPAREGEIENKLLKLDSGDIIASRGRVYQYDDGLFYEMIAYLEIRDTYININLPQGHFPKTEEQKFKRTGKVYKVEQMDGILKHEE